MGKHPKSTGWLARFVLSAMLILAVCAIVTARFGHTLQLPAMTVRDTALLIANRYVDNPVPDIALVGSSIAYRLREEYFSTPGLRNLALPGGSGLTGLQIIANQRQLPKLIVFETNVMSRPIDTEVIERSAARAGGEAWFLLPVRNAIGTYENWKHEPPTYAQFEPTLRYLLAQPPSGFDNRTHLDVAVRRWDSEDPSAVVATNVDALRRLVDVLEQRGARVLLMEVPCADPIEASLFARKTREIVHAAFPDAARWLPFEVQRSELRWNDGVHLDERSAVIVSRYLDDRFFSKLASFSPAQGSR